ncbi:hypothetical protein D1872_329620 [compost metagenome]
MPVDIAPLLVFVPDRPNDLRIRTPQHDIAPTLQLLSVPGIDNLIIVPVVRYIHVP